eukprot:TRINITY_DN88325_c0_g1_i1.p1 TRINITY_DN88325_c0_g1~~TRINITY_DN88325_c0_g1_i1.p1  ORF type:complete len:301 (-),score=-19.97 TRINITY_DN88325_c0_g1_i1:36-938(-)
MCSAFYRTAAQGKAFTYRWNFQRPPPFTWSYPGPPRFAWGSPPRFTWGQPRPPTFTWSRGAAWEFGPQAGPAGPNPFWGSRVFSTPFGSLPPWHSFSGKPWVGDLYSAYGRGLHLGYLNGLLGGPTFYGGPFGGLPVGTTPGADSVKTLEFVTTRTTIVYKGALGIPTICGSDGVYTSRAYQFEDTEAVAVFNGPNGPWLCRGPNCVTPKPPVRPPTTPAEPTPTQGLLGKNFEVINEGGTPSTPSTPTIGVIPGADVEVTDTIQQLQYLQQLYIFIEYGAKRKIYLVYVMLSQVFVISV